MSRRRGSAVAVIGAVVLTLGLITATPQPSAAEAEVPAARVVAVALVAATDHPAPSARSAVNDVSDFLNSLPTPIPEIYHSVVAIGFFFVFIPAFWLYVNVASAANVVLHAFGLPLLPNVLNPPFGPSLRTAARALPPSTQPALRPGTGRSNRPNPTAPKATADQTRSLATSKRTAVRHQPTPSAHGATKHSTPTGGVGRTHRTTP